jgi:hypothetical protein
MPVATAVSGQVQHFATLVELFPRKTSLTAIRWWAGARGDRQNVRPQRRNAPVASSIGRHIDDTAATEGAVGARPGRPDLRDYCRPVRCRNVEDRTVDPPLLAAVNRRGPCTSIALRRATPGLPARSLGGWHGVRV